MVQRSKYLVRCLLAIASLGGFARAEELHDRGEWRKPVAAVLLNDDQTLVVANSGTGSLSVIGFAPGADGAVASSLQREVRIGTSLTDLVQIPATHWLLATVAGSHQLRTVKLEGNAVVPGQELDVAEHPVSVCVSNDGTLASVASLWSRKLTLVGISRDGEGVTLQRLVELPVGFAPRLQLILDDNHILVADAFGGKLALLDVGERTVRELRPIKGGNIRGLALSHDRQSVVFAHSIQNPLAYTDFNDVHWGMLTQNVLREIPLSKLLDQTYTAADVKVRQVGQPGFGAADLAGLVQQANGEWLVLSSGTGDVSILQTPAGVRDRVHVGDRPLKVLLHGESRAYVVNQLSDSISVVDPQAGRLIETISLGPNPPPTPASRGERLFFSSALAHDNWLSCHSCHVDGHTTDGLVDTHSDGTFGTPKRILSLLGTRDANPWAWNGGFRDLHEQVSQSVTSSMQGPQPTVDQVSDLVAYLHTLSPAPPIRRPTTDAEKTLVVAGRQVFEREACAKCHVPSLTFTTDAVFDVGLVDELGLSKFNPPSLRGVSQRSAFLHDGRAKSLRSVLEDHSHQLQGALSPTDLNALLEFLQSI
jgi:YVTN family beta-propeller protein